MDLKTLYGKKYRIFYDESYQVEKEIGKTAEKWRFAEMRGKYGVIYPFGVDQAALTIFGAKNFVKVGSSAIKKLQDGDVEQTFLIKTGDIEKLANLIKARKRRQISPEQREKLIQQLQKAV